jgi:hypothetical protein
MRHPSLPSIQIWDTGARLPVFRFFETSDLTGVAAMVLDSDGLKLDGTVICRWDRNDGERMLGLRRSRGSWVRGGDCPADLPIWSEVTDIGLGSPALFIGLSKVESLLGQVRYRSRTFYFDLRSLPGDPHPSDSDPQPFVLPARGEIGWTWKDSQTVDDERVGRALAKKLEDVEYAKFYHGIRQCFLGRDYRCLNQYLHPKFEFEPWDTDWPAVTTRRQFARTAWQTSLWSELAWCFLRGRPVDDGMTFQRDLLVCSVQRYGAKYGLISCFVGE